jgi:arylsulfatase
MDLMAEEALSFVRQNRDRPFFLFLPFPVPHVSLQVPEDSVDEYRDAFSDSPYLGDRGYLPHPTPRAAYAAMITRMDREIGRLMALLEELDLEEDTLVLFTSDNGPTFNGGTDSAFFNSAGPLRGLKTELYEGGIRVPLVARWPGHIPPGTVSEFPSAFWDFLPTFADLLGLELPVPTDGVSLLPALVGDSDRQAQRPYLYWEFQGRQALRMGGWKAYRHASTGEVELYDLVADLGEEQDVSGEFPEVVSEIVGYLDGARTESDLFPLMRAEAP